MSTRIAELCESLLRALLRVLLPARGRHRATSPQPPYREMPLATPSPPCPHRPLGVWPYGHNTHLVRSYLLTPEERRERRLQRQRRRELWLAVQGIDVGPRCIHGVELPA